MTKIGDQESSDQQMVHGLSGNDQHNSDNFAGILNIPNNENEIMEFESFMNNISSKLKEKEEKKKKKLK